MAKPISGDLIGLSCPQTPDAVPQELRFFRPPKGIDSTSPLSEVAKEYGVSIENLILDRGVMKSRRGLEVYHDGQAGNKIQWTADIRGSASNSVVLTNRSTVAQTNAGWVDPDGAADNVNSVIGGPGTTTVDAASRLYVIIGDPAADNNVDAYDDKYTIGFSVTVDHGTVPSGWTVSAEVDIEVSTDGGANYADLGGGGTHNAQRSTAGTTTNTYAVTLTVSGSPTQVRFRLKLRLVVQGPSGSASANVAGGAAATWITSAGSSTPDRLPTRWTQSKLQIYEDVTDVAGPWTDRYTFPATQINTDSLLPSYIVWGDSIISTDIGDTPQGGGGIPIGSKGLISTLLASPHTTSILTHSPRAARLFILGNRVIAVRTNEWSAPSDPWVTGTVTNLSRIRWSVKNNSNDWDGIGSGFEDMPVPAGILDEAMAGVPVSDESALIVNEHTIRRMDVTGFVDAPFRFTLLTDALGTLSRYTVRGITGGAIFLGYDDVYIMTFGGMKRIGSTSLRDSIAQMTNRRLATAFMDHYNSRYIVAFKEGNAQVIWYYSFLDDGWTKLRIPFDCAAIDLAFFNVSGVSFFGAYFTQEITSGYSVRENPTLSRDVDAGATIVDSGIEARTGLIIVRNALHRVQLTQVQMLYESAESQDLTFEYSTDGGETWLAYGQLSIGVTTRPTVVRVSKPIEEDAIQVRVRSLTLGQLRIISLHVFAVEGGMIAA